MKKRKVPRLKTDKDAEAFLAQDLSDLSFSQFQPMKFGHQAKDKSTNLPTAEQLLKAVQTQTKRR